MRANKFAAMLTWDSSLIASSKSRRNILNGKIKNEGSKNSFLLIFWSLS